MFDILYKTQCCTFYVLFSLKYCTMYNRQQIFFIAIYLHKLLILIQLCSLPPPINFDLSLNQTTSKWDLKLLLHEFGLVEAHRGIDHSDQLAVKLYKAVPVLILCSRRSREK